jgi:3-isopropylmalate/(R)-2-methylmalate dehydratase small subunit
MKIIESKILPIPRKDIDTDLIIPADFLTTTTKEGLGQHVFDRLRKMEPDFPMNLPEYQDAQILVAGDNFGCGSSREHASWALADWGIKVIIAPSFASIFHANALNNGILCITLSEETVNKIFEQESVKVDLPNQTIHFANQTHNFKINPYKKTCLIESLSDMDYLLKHKDQIQKFEQQHSKNLFFHLQNL